MHGNVRTTPVRDIRFKHSIWRFTSIVAYKLASTVEKEVLEF